MHNFRKLSNDWLKLSLVSDFDNQSLGSKRIHGFSNFSSKTIIRIKISKFELQILTGYKQNSNSFCLRFEFNNPTNSTNKSMSTSHEWCDLDLIFVTKTQNFIKFEKKQLPKKKTLHTIYVILVQSEYNPSTNWLIIRVQQFN